MRGDTQRARERLDLYLQGGPVPALGHLSASAWSRRLQLDPRSHCLTGLCHPDPKMSLFDHVVSEKGRRLLRTQHTQGSFLSSLQDRGLGQEQHNCPWPPGGGSGFGEVRKEQPGPPDPLPPCRRDCPQRVTVPRASYPSPGTLLAVSVVASRVQASFHPTCNPLGGGTSLLVSAPSGLWGQL